MAAISIQTGFPKEILARLPELLPHNWLISGLDCVDYCGWEGCEKWAKETLFLTDKLLKQDVNLRNMQILWGVFSAIPVQYTMEDALAYPLPQTETPYYLSSHILPQHPLAMLELYVCDGCFTIVSAHSVDLLKPLYDLPYETRDEEKKNQQMNAQLRRIQDALRSQVANVLPEIANAVQWEVWNALLRGQRTAVEPEELNATVLKAYRRQVQSGIPRKMTFWDPYLQA